MWFTEVRVKDALKSLVGERVARRVWGPNGNPNRYLHTFGKVTSVTPVSDGSWVYTWEDGQTATLRGDTILVTVSDTAEGDQWGISLAPGDQHYLTFWDGQEDKESPTVDGWVADYLADRLVVNGTSAGEARKAISKDGE